MKKAKFLIASIIVISLTAINIALNSESREQSIDIYLGNIDASAREESSNHGRPLLQSASGAYKCANCSGTDCGAAC